MDLIPGSEFRALIFNAARDGYLERLKVFLDEPRSAKWIESCLNDTTNENIPLVIAARYGFIEVVKYLVSKGADASVRGTVSFDGEVISSAPALWAAAAAGHLHVVQYLVLGAHADINQPTATNSTPLRGACYDGHLDIVRFLIEHGANMEIANRHGHTPLMIACFRGKSEVAEYLLQKGADIQKQSHKGNTALHDAAEGDRADICEMLIRAGATLKEDDTGLCPLMSSAMLGNDKTLPMLMPICSSNLKRRDALKILGCTLCDKKMNMHGAIEAWKAAVSLPLSSDEDEYFCSETFKVPEVYGKIKEVETMDDVLAIEGQPEVIHMMALLIRERILGGSHPDVHYYIRFRGAVYCDLGRVTKCFDLWLHALKLQQEHLNPANPSTLATFQAFQETYAMAANEHRINREAGRQQWPVDTNQVLLILDRLSYEFERLADWPKDCPLIDECCDHDHNIEDDKRIMLFISLYLILLVKRFNIVEPIPDVDCRRLVKVCKRLGLLPLHKVLEEHEEVTDIHERERHGRDEFPSAYIVQQLLKSGADLTEVDSVKNTPLHVLLLNQRPRESIVRLLLDYGAPLLARNEQDNTCLDLMELAEPNLKNIRCGRYISLMGLAANAVNRAFDSCQVAGAIPKDMLYFLSYH